MGVLAALLLILEARRVWALVTLSGVPVSKEFAKLGDCCELLMVDRDGGVFHRAREKVESTEDAIALDDGGLGEVVVHKLNGVRKQECFGDVIGYTEAAVVVEC